MNRHGGAESSARAVALHRGAEPAPDGVGHLRRVIRSVGEVAQRDGAGSPPAGPREGLERRTVADAPDQAERRFRPRARRARSTARPPLVRMRRRKPWVLARLRLFGWYVRFNEEPPRGGRARPESRGPRGRRKPPSVRLRPPRSQRGGAGSAGLGKTPAGPCRTRMPVLRCAPRSTTARRVDFPARIGRPPAPRLRRCPHLWTLLWTTSGDGGQRPDRQRGGPQRCGREKKR